jgi:hypothetical protein
MSTVTSGPSALTGCVVGVQYAVCINKNGVGITFRTPNKADAVAQFEKEKAELMKQANRGALDAFGIDLYELRPLDGTQYKK